MHYTRWILQWLTNQQPLPEKKKGKRQAKPVAHFVISQRDGVSGAAAAGVRLATPGKMSRRYFVSGTPICRHDSTIERMAAPERRLWPIRVDL